MRASITRLATRVRDVEGRVDRDDTQELAKQAKQKLEKLDVDFKTHNYNLINVIDDEDSLLREQVIIDEHDDEQAILAIRVQQLITTYDSSSQVGTVHPHCKNGVVNITSHVVMFTTILSHYRVVKIVVVKVSHYVVTFTVT